MFKTPNINVTLAVNDGRTVLLVRRDGDAAGPSWIRWDLRESEREGHLALCQRIGSTALTMLIAAHPEEFAKFPLLVPLKPSPLDELHETVLRLINLSIKEKTTAYVTAIDNLFARHAELGQTELPDTWPSTRLRVMEWKKD